MRCGEHLEVDLVIGFSASEDSPQLLEGGFPSLDAVLRSLHQVPVKPVSSIGMLVRAVSSLTCAQVVYFVAAGMKTLMSFPWAPRNLAVPCSLPGGAVNSHEQLLQEVRRHLHVFLRLHPGLASGCGCVAISTQYRCVAV